MKKKLFTILTLLLCVCSGAWAADAVSATRTYSNGNATCTWTITAASVSTNVTTPFGADGLLFTTVSTDGAKGIALGDKSGDVYTSLKLNTYGNAIYVAVPSSTSHGTITLKSTGNNTHRTVNLKSGTAIGMNSSTGITANFVASDLEEVSGSYYIKLVNTGDGTSDASADYKIAVTNGISVTLTDETYTITTPTITLDKTSAIIRATESGTAATATINVTAANLTASGTLNATMSPSVDNLSVSPTSVSIAADGSISSTYLTVSFTATSNVTSGSTTLTLSDGTTSVDVPIYYSAVITPWTLQSISESTTWTFDDTNIPSGDKNVSINTETVYANIDGMAFGSDFNATALAMNNGSWPYYSSGKFAQAKSFKFNTTVAGTVKVTYNKPGNDAVYISVNSADNGSASSTTTTDAIAVSAGDVVIAGYTSAEHTDAALLNVSKIEFVKAVAVTGVELNKTSTSIEVGATETLTATVAPADATNKSVTWTSSNEAVATVDGGVVTGVAAGTATITVTTMDGSFTATCTVTVIAAETPIVTLPTSSRTGYSSSVESSDINGTDYAMNGRKAYSLSNGGSMTLTVPSTTRISRIRIIGTSADNSTASTVTITGVTGESASSAMNLRKAASVTSFDFVPTTQTTTYTIASANKGSYIQISIYGTENSFSTKSGRNYATYVTNAKLDFANASGITAYIATGFNTDKDAIVLQSVDVVPANTPIIVKTSTQGATVVVDETTDDATDVSSNALVAGDGTTAWDGTTGYTYYYLASDLFHEATSGTLQSGKAYLKVASGGGAARQLGFIFGDDEATSVNEVQGSKFNVQGDFYDLQGRRIAQPTKGLYIVNGKKVIIK